MEIEIKIQLALNDLDTIFREECLGIVSEKFIKLVDDTKETIKNKEQTFNNLTVEIALQIDKAFDEYLESKR
jgi:hypothetical protein